MEPLQKTSTQQFDPEVFRVNEIQVLPSSEIIEELKVSDVVKKPIYHFYQ